MKRLILVFSIFTSSTFSVYAQEPDSKATHKLITKLTQVCQLSPDQVSKIEPIAAGYVNTRKANKVQYGNDPVALKTANKSAEHLYKTQLKTVLSPEQSKMLKNFNATHKGKNPIKQEEEQPGEEQDNTGEQK